MDATQETLRLLTAADLAAEWQVDKSTVYHLIRTGELPAVRIGERSVRIRPEDAAEYLRRKTA